MLNVVRMKKSVVVMCVLLMVGIFTVLVPTTQASGDDNNAVKVLNESVTVDDMQLVSQQYGCSGNNEFKPTWYGYYVRLDSCVTEALVSGTMTASQGCASIPGVNAMCSPVLFSLSMGLRIANLGGTGIQARIGHGPVFGIITLWPQ